MLIADLRLNPFSHAFGAARNARKMPGPIGRRIRDLILPTIFKHHSSPTAMQELVWLFDHQIDPGPEIARTSVSG